MIIENLREFRNIILNANVLVYEVPELQPFEECINHYGSMCGCEPEAKEMKLKECEDNYRVFVAYNLHKIADVLKEHFKEEIFFYSNGNFINKI